MFERQLSGRLEYTENNDKHAVLATIVNMQLCHLANQSIRDMRDTLDKYYKTGNDNFQILKNAANDDNCKRPILFCCHALITDNINELNAINLGYTIDWLYNNMEKRPEYASLLNSMHAIQAVKECTLGEKVAIPSNCYLNLASAALSDADLAGLDLQFANLRNTNLEGADLSEAKLDGALMKNTNLKFALMKNASLQDVKLDGSLHKADLSGADLRGAKLCSINLDLLGTNLVDAKMDRRTQFFYIKDNASESEFETYVFNKKSMLSQARFLNDKHLTSATDLNRALVHLYSNLKDNRDFERMQSCIGYDFINRALILKDKNPELVSDMRGAAYVNPMFGPRFGLFRVVNDVIDTCLDFINEKDDGHAIESDAQVQMRATLRN